MRNRILVSAVILFAGCTAIFAQKPKATKWFIDLQGGASFSVNENCGAYFDEGKGGELFRPMGGISFGYYFVPRWGMRLQCEYGTNVSAANYQDNNRIFQPYNFQSIHAYADCIVSGGDLTTPSNFNWRFFAGVGYAHSFNFSVGETELQVGGKPYVVSQHNDCFSFRYGFILEYIWACGVGIFFEGGHEWMTDKFNGVQPMDEKGNIIGFPFDTRFNNQIGVTFNF